MKKVIDISCGLIQDSAWYCNAYISLGNLNLKFVIAFAVIVFLKKEYCFFLIIF